MAHYYRYIAYLLAVAFIVFGGCIREDLSDCGYLTLKFKVSDSREETNAGTDAVDSAQVYLFDSRGYVRTVEVGDISKHYTLGFEKSDEISIAAWGNLRGDSIGIPVMHRGMCQTCTSIKLKKQGEYCTEPPDLFFASYRSGNTVVDTVILTLERIVSSVTITGKHILERFGTDTADCYFVIRGTKDGIDFDGKTWGSVAAYKPAVFFDAEHNLKTPVFKILPQAENEYLTVELYRGNEKLYSTHTDSDGKLLRAYAGKQLNIVLDFNREDVSVGIRVIITPWGETWQETVM